MTYNKTAALLREAGIENAETDAAILFEHFGAIPPHMLPFRKDEDVSSPELLQAIERRSNREPLQYILGFWEFCGLRFELNNDCLCPRPDTELIVELALKRLPPSARFCDIGTGSGAIAVSILHHRRDTSAVGFDINENALAAARNNAAVNSVADRITFIKADALAQVFLEGEKFDSIISNPPYIPKDDIPSLAPEVLCEPRRALDGGPDGLIFYRKITEKAVSALNDGGFILYEVGIGQAQDVCAIGQSLGFRSEIFCDLGGVQRAVLLTR